MNVNNIAEMLYGFYPLGRGIDTINANVKVLVEGNLYSAFSLSSPIFAGGFFSSAGGNASCSAIAKWTGSTWMSLGDGLDGGVYTIAISSSTGSSSTLYAGGEFQHAVNGVPANKIAYWNGSSWDSLPGGNNLNSNTVYALTFYNGSLIAGGDFTFAGSTTLNYIAQWNGSSWAPLGSGMDNSVFSLHVYNGSLIAGGAFTNAGGVNVNYIAKWNGSSWSALGSGVDAYTNELCVFHNKLIAGLGGIVSSNYHYLAQWNDTSWSSLGGGAGGFVSALYPSWDRIYVGGGFTTVGSGGTLANNMAEWIEPAKVVNHRNGLNKPITGGQNTKDSIGLPGGHFDVSPSLYITNVSVSIDTVNYPIDSDLEFQLIHQSVTDTIIYQAGGNGANFTGTILSDTASTSISNGSAPFTGSFRAYKPLSQCNGLDPSGLWILNIYDKGTGHTGTLEAWSLDITYGVNPIGIKPISSEVPKSFKLMQNYPNPFNPSTKINFALPKDAFAKIIIYDVLGREVATLVNEQLKAGTYQTDWNAANYSSGVYFYRLETNGYTETKKMVLIK